MIPGFGGFSRVGNGNPLQYFCLENFKDWGGYSHWNQKESDPPEQLTLSLSQLLQRMRDHNCENMCIKSIFLLNRWEKWICNISFFGYITIWLSILLLMAIWMVLKVWAIMNKTVFKQYYTSLFIDIHFNFLWNEVGA